MPPHKENYHRLANVLTARLQSSMAHLVTRGDLHLDFPVVGPWVQIIKWSEKYYRFPVELVMTVDDPCAGLAIVLLDNGQKRTAWSICQDPQSRQLKVSTVSLEGESQPTELCFRMEMLRWYNDYNAETPDFDSHLSKAVCGALKT